MIRTACMGGWCALRDRCARYHDTTASAVAERICIPGCERPVPVFPITLRPAPERRAA